MSHDASCPKKCPVDGIFAALVPAGQYRDVVCPVHFKNLFADGPRHHLSVSPLLAADGRPGCRRGFGDADPHFLLQAKRFPYLIVGWLWFLGTLVPVIGLVQVGVQAMGRPLYLFAFDWNFYYRRLGREWPFELIVTKS